MKIYFKGTEVHNDPIFYLGNKKINLTNTSQEHPLEVEDDVGRKLCGDLPFLIFEAKEKEFKISPSELLHPNGIYPKPSEVTEITHTISAEPEKSITFPEKPKFYIVTKNGDGKKGLKDDGLFEEGKIFSEKSRSVRSIPQMLMWGWIEEYKE